MSFTVDHHILPDVFWRATNDAHNPVGGILPAPWSKESTLSYTDDAGIDVAITSISTPGVHMGDDSAARDLARRVNELSAELIQDRPDRFGGFSIIDEMNVIPGAEERGTAADTLRRLYWDTALSWRPPVLRMLRSVVGMGQVLFGSDYPYLRRDLAVACRQEVETSAELDSEESRGILAANALKLFPRLAARVG